MKKNPLVFLRHILDSIKEIEEFTSGLKSREEFLQKKVVSEAVIRKIEIIGEAVINIPSDVKDNYLNIPWKEIAGMRDKLIHNYFEVDLNRVWITVKKDLPFLKKEIEKIVKKLA